MTTTGTTLTGQQYAALRRKWEQDNNGVTFGEFLETVQPEIGSKAVMVKWCGMWLGVEPDGYTHS